MIRTSFRIVFEYIFLHPHQKKFQNIGTPPLPAIIHLPLAHLPRSNMEHLPGKWHICPGIFDTFALKMGHLPRSKRAHFPRKTKQFKIFVLNLVFKIYCVQICSWNTLNLYKLLLQIWFDNSFLVFLVIS